MRLTTMRRAGLVCVITAALLAPAGAAGATTYDWHDVDHPAVTVDLAGVAAPGPGDAWAVGQRLTDDARLVGYAEHWDGAGWSEVTLPGPDYHTFTAVSAGSSRDVWVLADTHGQGQTFRHWDGQAWVEVAPATLPGYAGQTVLTGVSALPGGTAWAVGFHTANYPYDTVVERWDGTAWQRVPTPGQHLALRAVSAVADDDVWAVGWLTQDGQEVLATLHWDGRSWQTGITAVPGKAAQLMDVSAVSHDEVWAAGVVEGVPVALRWDGTRWQTLRQPTVGSTEVAAVVADGRGGAWIAGDQYDSEAGGRSPLYLHWDGRRWARASSQQPDGAVRDLTRDGQSLLAVGTSTWCDCFVGQPLVQTYP